MAVGGALSGTGILTVLAQTMPGNIQIPPAIIQAAWWVAFAGVILGVIGKAWTAFFAADAATVNNVAQTVDKMNALGTDPGLPTVAQSPVSVIVPTQPAAVAAQPKV